MKLKDDSVNIHGLKPEMQPVLKLTNKLWKLKNQRELTITSARDGMHSAGSLHYYGYAVDIRTWGIDGIQLSMETKKLLADTLRAWLLDYSQYYDVIVHSTHIHIEWDFIRAGKLF